MKRRITAIVLGMLLCMSSAFGLSACRKKKPCTHEYSDWTLSTAATCTENGEKTRTCTKCGETEKEAVTALGHTPNADDGDCTTAVTCRTCGTVVTAAHEQHEAGEDDGNCMTPVGCKNCQKNAVDAKDKHTDTDEDHICDNPGCQMTVDGAPEDTSEGTDFPMDKN